MPQFSVDFEDPKGFFYPGEIIVGRIILSLDKAIKCKKTTLKFKGESRVRWTTGSGNEREDHTNHEVYFDDSVTPIEPQKSDKEKTLHPGEVKFPFRFQLPANLPPSTSTYQASGSGGVYYIMKIKVAVLKSEDISAAIPVEVGARPINLNEVRNLLEPMTHTEEKYLCCLCCQSGPLRICITIQKQVYYVGEQIIFSVEVDNKETDKPVGKIEARLNAWFTFISKSGNTTSVFSEKQSSVQLTEGVPPRGDKNWHDVTLNIPSHSTPTFDNCKCIHLDYWFTVKVEIGLAFDPKVYFPIKISSRPQTVQHVNQPPFIQGNVRQTEPCVTYPPHTTGVPPSMVSPFPSTIPTAGYPPPSHFPPIVTQQPTM